MAAVFAALFKRWAAYTPRPSMNAEKNTEKTKTSDFIARRKALLARIQTPVLLVSGFSSPRNYRANVYPFRASSHFLYFVGEAMPGSALLFLEGRAILFAEPPNAEDALWHGPRPTLEEVRVRTGVDEVRALSDLSGALAPIRASVATLSTPDHYGSAWLTELLGRDIKPNTANALEPGSADETLANAMIDLRLRHDAAALAQLRAVGQASAHVHVAAMKATRPGGHEAGIAAVILSELKRRGLVEAYGSIVTVHGEVLHNEEHIHPLRDGDLLLVDAGGEQAEGWAADITRTWPVSGRYSATQKAIYDVVLDAQLQAIAKARSGVSYRSLHETAKRAIVSGLRSLGIFRGEVDGLLERGAASIFFPHGIGHLLGLDVHDMEDLGDRAGYAPGRTRSKGFGDCYLRLDRELEPGMLVTIEPGFYQVPAILESAEYTGAVGSDLDRDVLAKFSDVRGIRIEDDVLVTSGEPEIFTKDVPKRTDEIEALMRG